MKKFIGEFKTFIMKGNVIDLAIAFIIGAAFKDIVNSLVKDILSPVISLVVGEGGFSSYKYIITEANELTGVTENAIYYGNFLQSVLDFFVIALVVFIIIKAINKAQAVADKLKNEAVEEVVEVVSVVKPKVEDILLDIKDLLTINNKKD